MLIIFFDLFKFLSNYYGIELNRDASCSHEDIRDCFDFIKGRRGKGFMQGLIIDPKVKPVEIMRACLDRGLVVLTAGSDVVRMLPPLVAESADMDEMYQIMDDVLAGLS